MTKILYVEDDHDDVDILKEATRETKVGLEIIHAIDGFEGLELCERHRGRLSLILIDMNLPRMNGLEFLTTIKRDGHHCSKTPAVIFTTSATPGIKEKAIELGAIDFLIKPTSFPAYCNIVTTIYSRSLRQA